MLPCGSVPDSRQAGHPCPLIAISMQKQASRPKANSGPQDDDPAGVRAQRVRLMEALYGQKTGSGCEVSGEDAVVPVREAERGSQPVLLAASARSFSRFRVAGAILLIAAVIVASRLLAEAGEPSSSWLWFEVLKVHR